MAKKGQKFRDYATELKKEAVRLYEQEGLSYQGVADQLGITSNTQVKQWVKKHRNGEALEGSRDAVRSTPRRGRPKTNFASVEEERDYLKAEVEYLKKLYANLHGKK
jgi:transposase